VYQRALRNHQRRLGEKLRGIREELKLTQAQAAEQIGLSRNQVVRIEAGQSNITLATVVAAALTYGVEVGELFDRNEGVRRSKVAGQK
jgi:transcriptional regulator with XRE-family HTH domain